MKSGKVQNVPTIDDLILLDGNQIKAIKKAILQHKWENSKSFDRNQPNLQEILKFKFRNGLSTLLSNYDRWLPVKQTNKSVRFKNYWRDDGSLKIKGINLTMEELELSTFFGVSCNGLVWAVAD